MIASSALGPRGPVDVHDAPALRHLLEHHRLCTEQHQRFAVLLGMQFALAADPGEVAGGARATAHQLTVRILQELGVADGVMTLRSEERRVGKGCVRSFRSRWTPCHKKKKTKYRY